MRILIVVITFVVLLGGLGVASAASYQGFGLVSSGAPWVRVGSIGGPSVVGGGPGSGK
jgi:hypothetical protein